MNGTKKAGLFFLFLGGIFLILMTINIVDTINFLSAATKTRAEIVDIIAKESRSKDQIEKIDNYYPVVRFKNENGRIVELESNTSSMEDYRIGDFVQIHYISNPPKLIITEYFLLTWISCLILSLFAIPLSLIGGFIFWMGIKEDRKELEVLGYSKLVNAKVISVARRNAGKGNKSPYIIKAEWIDTVGEKHQFESDFVSPDPSRYIGETIEIKMDNRDYSKYFIDLSFLPDNYQD